LNSLKLQPLFANFVMLRQLLLLFQNDFCLLLDVTARKLVGFRVSKMNMFVFHLVHSLQNKLEFF